MIERLTHRALVCFRPLCMSLMCVLMAVMASPVFAQDEELRVPRTTEDPSSPKYLILLVAVLLTAGVVFAASLKSKRTHQD